MSLTRALPARAPFPILNTPSAPRRFLSTAAFHALQPTFTDGRRQRTPISRRYYATSPPENIAVIGGGITGLTTAYYLARWLPSSSRVTLYEAANREGGWVHTVEKEADGGVVHFENGPRMLRGLGKTGFRADDYVFYDLVWIASLVARDAERLLHTNGGLDCGHEASPQDLASPKEALLLRRQPRPPPPAPNPLLPRPHGMAVRARQARLKRHAHRRPPLPAQPYARLPARRGQARHLDR